MSNEPSTSLFRKSLFDHQTFNDELPSHSSLVIYFKDTIKASRAILNASFKNNGEIENIIADTAWFFDQILISAWQQFDWKDKKDISLIAVGGYGRSELHPYSDIDIQILLREDSKEHYQQNIEQFLTFLWDINLDVGQSVRTIEENKNEAASDITIATALMESRTIYGNPILHEQVMDLVSPKYIWQANKFYAAKVKEQEKRHSKYDDIEYALEPNLKSAPGGLRDIQTIAWIANRYFGISGFLELVERGILHKTEYHDLIRGRNFLWKLRYGLHMVTERKEDRLLFEHQRTLADILNYKDDEFSLGIEKLMKEYYLVVQILRELNDVLLQLFDEEIIRSKEKVKIQKVNARFQIYNNYIEVCHSQIFQQSPSALIEIFVLFANDKNIEGIRASTIRLIRNSRHLIDNNFKKSEVNTSLFMKFLSSPYKMVQRLRQMKRYGILAAYLPEFGKIIGQMQHDLFHIYTVDDHTLQVMENMRRFRHESAKEKYPLAAQLITELPSLTLLYISGLYHDIAKGRGGDHSELGVEDAVNFCERHGIDEEGCQLVGWLVKSHLIMSAIAQKEDLQDPDTIKRFALNVKNQKNLDYLYVLTVADINGTNPKLWNTWRASLLRQLYYGTSQYLAQESTQSIDKEKLIAINQKKVLDQLKIDGISNDEAYANWEKANNDYFLRESVEDIIWHAKALAKHKVDTPMVLIKNSAESKYEGATQIFISAISSKILFANIATAFDRLNMNIQDARIYNTDGKRCFISFMILESDGAPINNKTERINEIVSTVMDFAQSDSAKYGEQNSRTSRKLRHFTSKAKICLINNDNTPYSTLEVISPDRPGLLAKIANIFVEMDIILLNAKITNLGENIEDIFFITNENNTPIIDPQTISNLQSTIEQQLNAGSSV